MVRRSSAPARAAGLALVLGVILLPGPLHPDSRRELDVQAHRGGRGRLPENTLAAFRWAIDLGVDTLEMDLALTRDRVVVVSHGYRLDPDLTRDAAGHYLDPKSAAKIGDLDFQELRRYTVGEIRPGSEYGYRFREQRPVPGERIPSLTEVFALVREPGAEGVRLNLEIKTYPPFPEATVDYREFTDVVVELIREHGLESRVTVQSFDWRTLARIKEQAPELEIVCLTVGSFTIEGEPYNLLPGGDGPSPWLAGLDVDDFRSVAELVEAFGPETWSPYYREVEERDVAAAHRLGLKVLPWTVNDPRTMDKLLGWGVDGIITDVPDILLQVLAKPR